MFARTGLRARRGAGQTWWLIPAARCILGRGARTHLTRSSFRAFRFATRCPGGRRSCCVSSMPQLSLTTSQRQRKAAQRVSQTSPGWRFPQGPGVSVPDRRKGQPAFPRRRQEVCACADRPAEAPFSLPPGAAYFLFGVSMRGPRRAPRGGERRSKGAGAVFAAGGNGA